VSQGLFPANSVPGGSGSKANIGWGTVFGLVAAAFVSGLFTEAFVWHLGEVSLKSFFAFLVLAATSLGLALAAVLMACGKIRSWQEFSGVTFITVAAHLVGFFPEYFKSNSGSNANLPQITLIVAMLAASFIFFAALPYTVVGKCNAMRAVSVAGVLSVICTLAMWAGLALEDHSPLILLILPPGLVWQMSLGFFLGLALRSQRLQPPRAISRAGDDSVSDRSFAGFAVLLAYFILIGFWYRSKESEEFQNNHAIEDRVTQSVAEAPLTINLPPLVQQPLELVLVMEEIGGWKPYMNSSTARGATSGSGDEAAKPPVVLYSVRYGGPDGHSEVDAEVQQYPTSAWAQYELRNIPMPNEFIQHPDSVQKLEKFGNLVYHDGPYFYWSSGDKLIQLNCSGVLANVEDLFLKAYLEKYPSTV